MARRHRENLSDLSIRICDLKTTFFYCILNLNFSFKQSNICLSNKILKKKSLRLVKHY